MAGTTSSLTPEKFNNFGELLRFLRERAELSQRELALQVGYHYSYMSRIEKNERQPDSATLMARFIPALGLDTQPEWTERLLKLAASEEKTMTPRRGQVHASHPPVVASTLPTFDSLLNPLPLSLTPLLGREAEVEALTKLISRPDVRLVTLVGAPGVGKTRLAIHAANQLAGLFAQGAAFTDLSSVTEPKDVLGTLAVALGVQGSSDVPLMIQLVNTLKQKNILLVVNNFEHVIEASPQLVQLLGNAPQVKALIASREALRISGEYEFAVEPPLPVPPADASQSAALLDYASSQLFAQRAQAVDPNFNLTSDNLKSILEICRSLAVTSKIGDRHAEGVTYSNLALLYFVKENFVKAGECAEKPFAVFQTTGNEFQSPFALRMMGYSAVRAGNIVRARVLMQESLKGNYAIADTLGQLACLIGMANCDLAEKDFKSAVRLCALAETQREKNKLMFLEPDMLSMEAILKQAKKKLGKAAYEAVVQEGQSVKLENIFMILMAG